MNKKKKSVKTLIGEFLFAVLTVIILMPVYYFLIGSFKARKDIVLHPLTPNFEIGFKNFAYVWNRLHFPKALLDTAIITVVSLLLVVALGSLAGFAIARVKRKSFTVFYSALVALMVIPFIGCLIPLVKQSVSLGLYGSLTSVIVIQVAWNLPFATFLFVGFMEGIPKDLEEAAYIDGCSMFKTYVKVFIPLLSPVISTCCIRAGVGIWNDYLCTASLVNQVNTPTLMVGLYKFFYERGTEYGYAFAGIILASLPMIILFLCLQKNFIKGITAGAVKG